MVSPLPASAGPSSALALDAFARDSAGDRAIDSVVYDLWAWDPAVDPAFRFVGISRDGIAGYYADPDVAAYRVANRDPNRPRTLHPDFGGHA